MPTAIRQERPDTPDATQLIMELEATLAPHYPDESRHGYSVEKLIQQRVHFFVVRVDGVPAGCGGVQLFGKDFGELKRMYVRPEYRGQGLGKILLDYLTHFTQAQGIQTLRLETGIYQTEAIGMYERMGFYRIPPFGDYWDDPVSLCYEKQLNI
jgi:putative acetyltransferase